MSQTTSLHDEIMSLIATKMAKKEIRYADIFGALASVKAFFEVGYAMDLAAIWKETTKEGTK